MNIATTPTTPPQEPVTPQEPVAAAVAAAAASPATDGTPAGAMAAAAAIAAPAAKTPVVASDAVPVNATTPTEVISEGQKLIAQGLGSQTPDLVTGQATVNFTNAGREIRDDARVSLKLKPNQMGKDVVDLEPDQILRLSKAIVSENVTPPVPAAEILAPTTEIPAPIATASAFTSPDGSAATACATVTPAPANPPANPIAASAATPPATNWKKEIEDARTTNLGMAV